MYKTRENQHLQLSDDNSKRKWQILFLRVKLNLENNLCYLFHLWPVILPDPLENSRLFDKYSEDFFFYIKIITFIPLQSISSLNISPEWG